MRVRASIVATAIGVGLGVFAVGTLVSGAPAPDVAQATQRVGGMRRLTEEQYRNSIADMFGPHIQVQGRFEPERRVSGLLAAGSSDLSVTGAGLESYLDLADKIAAQVVSEANRSRLGPCQPRTLHAADDACATEILQHYGRMAFRRPLTAGQLRARVALASNIANQSKDFYAGLRYGLASLLVAPDFLFRTEVVRPSKDGVTLDGYSRAERLSFLMWNSAPDAELLQAAAGGSLDTDEGLTSQTDRLMASPRLEVGMRAFFKDMLQFDGFKDLTKDPTIYPKYSERVAESAEEESLRTIIKTSLTDDGDYRDILTTRKTFVDRTLAAIYGVPYSFEANWVPYEFPESADRSGILTQVSFLSLFSHPGRSSPTKRGVALREALMCEPTPAPPANVDFSVVNDVSNPALKTLRARLEAHAKDASCASCHTRTDPIGLSLEGFDSIGQRRILEAGVPIDVSATIRGKKFAGGAGLGKTLHDDPKLARCVVKQLYSYGVGIQSEDLEPEEYGPQLKAFTAGNYRLRVLLKSIATDPRFYERTPGLRRDAQSAAQVAAN